jgi:hypothetical protein
VTTTSTTAAQDLLLEALRQNEIKHLLVNFCGSSDSGDISDMEFVNVDDERQTDQKILEKILLCHVKLKHTSYYLDGNPRDFVKNPVNLREFAVDVCYDILEASHDGWEIGAGASGTITFTPLARYLNTVPVNIDIEYGYNDDDYDYEDEEYNDE